MQGGSAHSRSAISAQNICNNNENIELRIIIAYNNYVHAGCGIVRGSNCEAEGAWPILPPPPT